jgi:hypothetical protein
LFLLIVVEKRVLGVYPRLLANNASALYRLGKCAASSNE